MRRLGALAAAIALVVAAILVNGALHDDEGDDASTASGEPVRLLCATEFEDACTTLEARVDVEVTIEAPGATASALAEHPSPDFDLWITSEPWIAVADARAQPTGSTAPQLGEPERLASLGLGAITTTSLRQQLTEKCGMPIDGHCLLTNSLSLGARPTDQTATLLMFGWMLTGWADLPEDPGIGDIDAVDGIVRGLANVESRAKTDVDPVRTVLTLPKFDIAVDLGAAAAFDIAADKSKHTILPISPVTAIAVAVPANTEAGRAALERLGRDKIVAALADNGWSRDIPDDDGLPDPAVLDYLASRWSSR